MGLTYKSTGLSVNTNKLEIIKESENDYVVAVAGNPNVGKSTIFNALTGMNQHTGNWPGKTVTNAQGKYSYKNKNFILVDIPGTYSIMANSVEEEIARDFICFGNPDLVLVVVDATCLERNLNLVLQILEVTPNVVVCVNLLDEAKKKKIEINLDILSSHLGVPVVGTSARSGIGLQELKDEIFISTMQNFEGETLNIQYDNIIEASISKLLPYVNEIVKNKISPRWASIKLLDIDDTLNESISNYIGYNLLDNKNIVNSLHEIDNDFKNSNINKDNIRDILVEKIIEKSELIYNSCVSLENKNYNSKDRKLDKILTSKLTGIPIMILLLILIFWITITGANYPSELLSNGLFFIQDKLIEVFNNIGFPKWVTDLLVMGIYRTLAWVVAVMLPPMAIFFPLFTLLEDSGYLPRIAFNMDKFFKKACAHGKQALTMCMDCKILQNVNDIKYYFPNAITFVFVSHHVIADVIAPTSAIPLTTAFHIQLISVTILKNILITILLHKLLFYFFSNNYFVFPDKRSCNFL